MIVRNVAVQGYPYLEAIRSALPICDEFLVSDGFSSAIFGKNAAVGIA